jgi:tRNA threonylcarbamoyladenosine biosynthesis protein TsaE
MTIVVPTSADMEALGERLGAVAAAGDVIVLSGALGAGKTTFARGFGRALNLEAPVSSPTFVVARVHRSLNPGAPPLVHVDAYRLGSAGELDDLDIDVAGSIVLAEWAAPFVSVLSAQWLEIDIHRPSGGELVEGETQEPRKVTLTPGGADDTRYQRFVDAAVGF